MSEAHHIGNATILVSDDEFINSYQVGYLQYCTDYKQRILSEREIYDYLMQTCLDVQRPDRANAGRVAGWMAALHERERRP